MEKVEIETEKQVAETVDGTQKLEVVLDDLAVPKISHQFPPLQCSKQDRLRLEMMFPDEFAYYESLYIKVGL